VVNYRDLTITRDRLGECRPLGSGGQGRIFLVPELDLPGGGGPFVYKEYLPDGAAVSAQGMANIISLRVSLGPEQLAWFDNHLAWPLRIVVDQDRTGDVVVGVVMRLIPAAFFEVVSLTGPRREMPREARALFYDRARAERENLRYPDSRERHLLCMRLAYVIAFLHRHQIVFGDISSRNVLYRLAPTPDVLLVDCDAVRKVGTAPVVAQGHTPEFMPPDPYEPQSIGTDLFKLGMFVARILSPGRALSVADVDAGAPNILEPTGARMLRASLRREPAGRPTALDWYRYFHAVTGGPNARR
jgi:DNA-binding helix-hairpin-helix protein with protein kinase domain